MRIYNTLALGHVLFKVADVEVCECKYRPKEAPESNPDMLKL